MAKYTKDNVIGGKPEATPVQDKGDTTDADDVIGGKPEATPVQDKGQDPKDKNKVIGGLADNKPVGDIAKKHRVSTDIISDALAKGTKIEMEHTSDKDVAYEIAKDHIYEDPKYYEKLKSTNESELTKSIIKKFLREEVELMVSDETPESISVLIQYNGRNAGIIKVAPVETKEDALEITSMQFKEGYNDLNVMNQAVNALWPLFKEINSIIVAPDLKEVPIWNKLGFDRLSPEYLISNRGH